MGFEEIMGFAEGLEVAWGGNGGLVAFHCFIYITSSMAESIREESRAPFNAYYGQGYGDIGGDRSTLSHIILDLHNFSPVSGSTNESSLALCSGTHLIVLSQL